MEDRNLKYMAFMLIIQTNKHHTTVLKLLKNLSSFYITFLSKFTLIMHCKNESFVTVFYTPKQNKYMFCFGPCLICWCCLCHGSSSFGFTCCNPLPHPLTLFVHLALVSLSCSLCSFVYSITFIFPFLLL